MRTPASSFTLVLAAFTIMFAVGCRDEVAVALDEIEATQQEILALLERQVQVTSGSVAAAVAAEENARVPLENAGLTLDDNGRLWRNKARDVPCSASWPGGDPLCRAWKGAWVEVDRTSLAHELAEMTVNNRASGYAQRLEALRRAHEDDTWDVFEPFNPNASGRSIVITYLRELEDERARLQSTTDAPTR